ncbi:MAG TPA: hypothetical protein VK184_17095 [Nostocaceae cyanobacterium]|nr:hypothetical protein [Nostocaceae cyanobacterium]
MSDKQLVAFTLEDGGTILVEVEAPKIPEQPGPQDAGKSVEKAVEKASEEVKQNFTEVIKQIKPVVTNIADQFKGLNTCSLSR